MKTLLKRFMCIAAVIGLAIPVLTNADRADAASLGVDTSTPGVIFSPADMISLGISEYAMGYMFGLSQSVNVSGLGVFDVASDGLETGVTTGLMKLNTATMLFDPVSTAAVTSSSRSVASQSSSGRWLFADTDFNIEAGIYAVLAKGSVSYIGEPGFAGLVTDPLLTFLGDMYMTNLSSGSNTLAGTDTNGFYGGNIELNVIPLPGALPLFLSGLIGLGFFGRRRRRRGA